MANLVVRNIDEQVVKALKRMPAVGNDSDFARKQGSADNDVFT